MKRLLLLLAILFSLQVHGRGILRSELSLQLYNAMDSFVAANPDAISDFVYNVSADRRAEFGRRITGRPEYVPEKSDGNFPHDLEMLQNAVSAAEKFGRLPNGVYRSYLATGGGPSFQQKACAYRINFGSAVDQFEIDNALDEVSDASGYVESGAFKLTREEYVCAQYDVERLSVVTAPDITPLRLFFNKQKSTQKYKIKIGNRTINLRSVADHKAKLWRQAYSLIEQHLLTPEYIRIYYNRANRYIMLADKNTNKLYVAAYRNGTFLYGETTGTDLPKRWLDNLK